ncbi:laminin-like protein epi-1 [Pieris brassicae]|uniref:laminin-like protein epi-1 n=1 Tax=Pieris brassicae TaxID=7116 RepID=UPI001E661ED1|nr:laminin-like protein epi-1 [Pieris brassicae]
MCMTVTFLTLLSHLPYQIHSYRTCVPDTQFVLNNRLCSCNNYGLWSDASCKTIERRPICQIGQVVKEGCTQCICQQNREFVCSNICTKDGLSAYGPKCRPFKSYYVDCKLCTCPASGLSVEAHCSKDSSCLTETNFDFQVAKNNYCIPNVMYVFPCIECVCSENGFFVLDKCVEKCQTPAKQVIRRCIPGTYYRKDCHICLCPESSNIDENLCTRATCKNKNKPAFLQLRNLNMQCTPFTFLKPRCLFCDCSFEGTVDENRCVEIDCTKTSNIHLYPDSQSCSPGEVVPNCVECFCPKNGMTTGIYCTRVCNYQNKLRLLQKFVNESYVDLYSIKNLKQNEDDVLCVPNLIYIEDERYCLCPESGYKSFKFCTTSKIRLQTHSPRTQDAYNINTECEPGTFVTVDCNSCYCNINGTIDQKWCTNDDCEAKRTIVATHKFRSLPITTVNTDGVCTPGAISKVKCNFCICPESGILKDRACTKNSCYDEGIDQTIGMDKFTCEPLAYYEVDCNICFCPKDGIKNVAKCTKNHCQKNIMRSNDCTAGHLFTVDCNVCVCPPNGDKIDRVCTQHKCGVAPLNFSNLSQKVDKPEYIRSLDHCFPGEEFMIGCKICMCPEMGLKMYASCETGGCDDTAETTNGLSIIDTENTNGNAVSHNRLKRFNLDLCMEYTVHVGSERDECTPGSMYIVRCQQCICPYMGNINLFCRPLPKTTFCEDAFPGFNYLPMGRKCDKTNNTESTIPNSNGTIVLKVEHQHTLYKCEKPGKILDDCFICTCEDGYVIEEHCFKSDAGNCTNSKPLFLVDNKVVLN